MSVRVECPPIAIAKRLNTGMSEKTCTHVLSIPASQEEEGAYRRRPIPRVTLPILRAITPVASVPFDIAE